MILGLYKAWLDNLFDAVYVVDKDRRIVYWNKAAEEVTGYSESEVVGTKCSDNILCHVDLAGIELCKNGCPLHETICDGRKREAIVFLHHKEGHRVPVHIRISPIRNETDEIIGAVEIFSDRSKELYIIKELERHKRESMLDPLLEIGNRRYAEAMFQVRQLEFNITGKLFGVIFMDVDNFKSINDVYGHSVGDKVLLMVSHTVANFLRHFDTFIRWSGDEFLIYLSDVNAREDLWAFAERIRKMVQSSFITLGGMRLSVSVSLGATLIRKEDTMESVIERADSLMYMSKARGGNQCTIG
ncbi:MAG: sensor domain-containing diguanylate cyclase [Oscillochloridaceae bacterium]|nr:sensor domain-containing diguanylate cyclase [Chloroflexaceae bacterium]MDW8389458.1 sensor domain-containing diguanylate cyclase [Oscillochloridaceae bacterium]